MFERTGACANIRCLLLAGSIVVNGGAPRQRVPLNVMNDEKKTFTVRDRRHFTSEGDAREPAALDEEPRPAAPSPSPTPTSTSIEGADGGGAADRPDLGDPSFLGLVVSLAMQARSLLGEKADLAGARSLISLLEMLKEKTHGNRTAEESDVLESLLYELRIGFVERSRTDA